MRHSQREVVKHQFGFSEAAVGFHGLSKLGFLLIFGSHNSELGYMTIKPLRPFVVFVLLSGSCVLGNPQTRTSTLPTLADRFASVWPAICKEMVDKALLQTELKTILELAPVAEKAVCSCVEAGMRSDRYLSLIFAEKWPDARGKFDQYLLKQYVMGKMVSYSFSCLGQELERATNGIDPFAVSPVPLQILPNTKPRASGVD